MLVEVLILSAIIKVIVDRIRSRLPNLDGDGVTAVAAVVGVAIAWVADFNAAAELVGYDIVPWLGKTVTGLGIGLGAGFVSDLLRSFATATEAKVRV